MSRRLYRCGVCARWSAWEKGWRWWWGLPWFYACSDRCEEYAFGGKTIARLSRLVDAARERGIEGNHEEEGG